MSQTNATSFFAKGPTERGFETGDAEQIKIGVLATGNEKGVWARGPQKRRGNASSYIGVEAETFDDGGVGVYGIAHGDGHDGAGVYGLTFGADSAGVKGENQHGGEGYESGRHVGAGVLGRGYYGVHGQVRLKRDKKPRDHRQPAGVLGEADEGTGVRGKADLGRGVVGESIQEAGVYGSSKNSVGGMFESSHAQLCLVPASTIGPPKDGPAWHNVGELFCDRRGNLFVCVEAPATWKKVRLEDPSWGWFSDLIEFFGLGAILPRKFGRK